MALPTLELATGGVNAGNPTSHTIDLPVSMAAGELLIIWMSCDNQSDGVTIT